MKIDITLRHLQTPPPSIKEYITEKISRLDRFANLVARVQIVASDEHTHQQDKRYQIEGVAHLTKGSNVVAKVSGSCLFEATDALADRLEKQVGKIKEKERNHKGTSNSHRSEQAV